MLHLTIDLTSFWWGLALVVSVVIWLISLIHVLLVPRNAPAGWQRAANTICLLLAFVVGLVWLGWWFI